MTGWMGERPEDCAVMIGGRPYRVMVGMASRSDEPGIVLWQEDGIEDVWVGPVFVASSMVGYLVSEAIAAAAHLLRMEAVR